MTAHSTITATPGARKNNCHKCGGTGKTFSPEYNTQDRLIYVGQPCLRCTGFVVDVDAGASINTMEAWTPEQLSRRTNDRDDAVYGPVGDPRKVIHTDWHWGKS